MRNRKGFTLIELISSITLMSLLVSLLYVGTIFVVTQARIVRTQTLLSILRQDLSHRLSGIDSLPERFGGYKGERLLNAVMNRDINAGQNQTRMQAYRLSCTARMNSICPTGYEPGRKVLALFELERMYLPQTWEEAEYLRAYKDVPQISTDPSDLNESAEVLYWLLTTPGLPCNNPLANNSSEEMQTLLSFTADKDHDGNPEIVDSWETPLRFYRWPTRLLRSADFPSQYAPRTVTDNSTIPPTTVQRYIPPFSPDNLLFAVKLNQKMSYQPTIDKYDGLELLPNIVCSDAEILQYQAFQKALILEESYLTPHTSNQPMIVSAGSDLEFGLGNPVDKTYKGYWCVPDNPAQVYDNLTTAN